MHTYTVEWTDSTRYSHSGNRGITPSHDFSVGFYDVTDATAMSLVEALEGMPHVSNVRATVEHQESRVIHPLGGQDGLGN